MSEKHAVLYFQPGQLLFHTQGNLQGPDAFQKLIDWANGLAAPRGITLSRSGDVLYFNTSQEDRYFKQQSLSSVRQTSTTRVVVRPPRREPDARGNVYTSPEVRVPHPFSVGFTEAKSDRWPTLPVPANPDQRLELNPEQLDAHVRAQNELLDLAHFLDNNRRSAPVEVNVVSPVWITSIGSEPGGTGGPGGKPKRVSNADMSKYRIFPVNASTMPAVFNTVSQPGGGEGVVVAMLDTAYEPAELTDIYNKWVRDVTPPQIPNPIIDALIGPSGCLTVHNDLKARDCLAGVTIDGYDYVMKSHGLHGAGTIHSLAPGAEIHLYQVLNQYGLGDIRVILENLAKALADLAGRPLVINASLTFRIPESEADLEDKDDYGIGRSILSYRPSFLVRLICSIVCWIFESLLRLPCPGFCESWLERQARPFEALCDIVYVMNSRVIAAAGNDSKKGSGRHPARYPAASKSVVGVGALGSNGAPAPYSNLADQPPRTGITTLGGDSTKGIIGAYADPFPDDTLPNENGMGLWFGTSFATNIISGITAAVLSNLIRASAGTGRIPSTEDAIAELYRAQSMVTSDTEDVFQVEQR